MPKAGKKLTRYGLVLLGVTTTILGVIGIWVPGLPTTVFLLIAAWAFGKSNDRLYLWLRSIKWLKPALDEVELYQQNRSVSRRAKLVSQSCAWSSALLSLIMIQNPVVWGITFAAAISCSLFMWWSPTRSDPDLYQGRLERRATDDEF